jgi:hypothetical protein
MTVSLNDIEKRMVLGLLDRRQGDGATVTMDLAVHNGDVSFGEPHWAREDGRFFAD